MKRAVFVNSKTGLIITIEPLGHIVVFLSLVMCVVMTYVNGLSLWATPFYILLYLAYIIEDNFVYKVQDPDLLYVGLYNGKRREVLAQVQREFNL